MIQPVGVAGIVERSRVIVGRIKIAILGIELHVASYEEIDTAIAVVIEPGGTDGPAVHIDSGFRGHVGEGAGAIVVVEDRFAIAGDEEIHESIIVVIGCNGRGAEDVGRDSGLVRHVGEGSVPIVAVQMIVRRRGGQLLQRIRMDSLSQRLATGHIEVEKSVIVEVKPDTTGACALEQRSEFLRAEAMRELDASFRCGILKTNGDVGRNLRQQGGGH